MSDEPVSRGDAPSASGAEAWPISQAQAVSSAMRVWIQFKDVIFERMASVEAAVSALRRAKLTPEVRQKALLEAHRLAGSLGMFGLMEGTRLAREIEHLLGEEAVGAPEATRQLTELAAALRQILERGPA